MSPLINYQKKMTYKNIPFGELEAFNVLVEMEKGSNLKYEYDEASDSLKLDFTFQNIVCPFNYGSILRTLGGDSDPMDAIIISDKVFKSGEVVVCRAIGMMEMVDRGERDTKVIVVPVNDPSAEKYQSPSDLSPDSLEKWTAYYTEVSRQKNKVMEILGFKGKAEALEEIRNSLI